MLKSVPVGSQKGGGFIRTGNEPGLDGMSRQGAHCPGFMVLITKYTLELHSLSKGMKRGPGLQVSPAP